MRIELIDRIMFPVMASVCIKELRKEHPEWNAGAIKRNACKRFVKMLKETPSIGRLSQNRKGRIGESARREKVASRTSGGDICL